MYENFVWGPRAGIMGTFLAHFGGLERIWKHIAYKRGGGLIGATILGPKNDENGGFLVPKKFQNRGQNGTQKGKKINNEKNHFLKYFLMKIYYFPYLSPIEK